MSCLLAAGCRLGLQSNYRSHDNTAPIKRWSVRAKTYLCYNSRVLNYDRRALIRLVNGLSQVLCLSWYSSDFQKQRSTVQIQSMAKFMLIIVYWELNLKDENKEKICQEWPILKKADLKNLSWKNEHPVSKIAFPLP